MTDREWLRAICRFKLKTIWPTGRSRGRQWVFGHIGKGLTSATFEQLALLSNLLDYKLEGKKCPYHAMTKTRRDQLLPGNWSSISRDFKAKSNRICVGCGKEFSLDELTVDHKKPVFEGGESTADNLQIMCGPCHFKKTQDNKESQRSYRKFIKERLHGDVEKIRAALVDKSI